MIIFFARPGDFEEFILTTEEASRASKMRRKSDRDRMVTGQLLLNHALLTLNGAFSRIDRTCLICGSHAHGPQSAETASISLSHSGSLVVAAATGPGRLIGVDIEHIRPMSRGASDLEALAAWTRREAVAKATPRCPGSNSKGSHLRQNAESGGQLALSVDPRLNVLTLDSVPSDYVGAVATDCVEARATVAQISVTARELLVTEELLKQAGIGRR